MINNFYEIKLLIKFSGLKIVEKDENTHIGIQIKKNERNASSPVKICRFSVIPDTSKSYAIKRQLGLTYPDVDFQESLRGFI